MDAPRNELMQLLNAWARVIGARWRSWRRCGIGTAPACQGVPTQRTLGQHAPACRPVNEAYLRPIEWHKVGWPNRPHFCALAAKMMRGSSASLVSLTQADIALDRSAEVNRLGFRT